MSGLHVGVIMDGNGRWAQARGLPRLSGHRRGAEALRRLVEAAPGEGIGTLTAYAFSSDNWKRPKDEIEGLLRLFLAYLVQERHALAKSGVRLSVIGRRDRLPPRLVRAIEQVETLTGEARRLHLRLAIDYSARDAIVAAAAASRLEAAFAREDIAARVGSGRGEMSAAPEVDLLIRTGGERRLSDFLLWESAYAELWFTDVMWPEFDASVLTQAVAEFRRRDRRFGALAAPGRQLA